MSVIRRTCETKTIDNVEYVVETIPKKDKVYHVIYDKKYESLITAVGSLTIDQNSCKISIRDRNFKIKTSIIHPDVRHIIEEKLPIRERIMLDEFIMIGIEGNSVPSGYCVDHINTDRLDCRVENMIIKEGNRSYTKDLDDVPQALRKCEVTLLPRDIVYAVRKTDDEANENNFILMTNKVGGKRNWEQYSINKHPMDKLKEAYAHLENADPRFHEKHELFVRMAKTRKSLIL